MSLNNLVSRCIRVCHDKVLQVSHCRPSIAAPGLPRGRVIIDVTPAHGASGLPQKKRSPISGHSSRKNSTASVSPRAAALWSRAAAAYRIEIRLSSAIALQKFEIGEEVVDLIGV